MILGLECGWDAIEGVEKSELLVKLSDELVPDGSGGGMGLRPDTSCCEAAIVTDNVNKPNIKGLAKIFRIFILVLQGYAITVARKTRGVYLVIKNCQLKTSLIYR